MEDVLLVVGGVVAGWLLSWAQSYFSEKGRNLATKEDVGAITREVERVKDEVAQVRELRQREHDLLLRQQDYQHQMRLAALDRRLQAHQEAYTLWWELITKAMTTEVYEAASACQTWWVRNSLYLGEDARAAFAAAWPAAHGYLRLEAARAEQSLLEAQWRKIERCGEVLARAVSLPPIAQDAGPTEGPPRGDRFDDE